MQSPPWPANPHGLIPSSDFIQVLLPVDKEIPVDPVIIRIFVSDFPDRDGIETVDLRIRKGKENGGMGGDDELNISPADELPE